MSAYQDPSAILRYVGSNRVGNPVTGALEHEDADTALTFTERKFKTGWRELFLRDESGELVGYIGPNADNGARTWWAIRA